MVSPQQFLARVCHVLKEPNRSAIDLPLDTCFYVNDADAWKHAKRQAKRWVNDVAGDRERA
jgi:hypothetical protein